MLDLVFDDQTNNPEYGEEFFRGVLETAISRLMSDQTKNVELGLHLITSERSRELNRQYRQKDKPTDVLSFPLDEHQLEKHGIIALGDIFICLAVARQQAQELDIPLNEELARLTIHGLLHCLGHDHETSPEDETTMIDLQEDIVDKLKVKSQKK